MQLIAKKLMGNRGEKLLFSNINFSLSSGQILLVLGENGTGKSTLLRIIAALYTPKQGEIFLKIKSLYFPVFPSCHYLGDKNAMKPFLTVFENLYFWHSFLKKQTNFQRVYPSFSHCSKEQQRFFIKNKSAVNPSNIPDSLFYALKTMQLISIRNIPFRMLSAGQKKRAAIARLLVADRPVWILDEPTVNLDLKAEMILFQLINHQLQKGGIVIVATHQPLTFFVNKIITLG